MQHLVLSRVSEFPRVLPTMEAAGRGSSAGATEHIIDVVGMGVGAAADTFVSVSAAAGYTVVATAPNRFRLARVFRPTWATGLAIGTAIFAGLGLLFLLVKRTETGDGVIVEDRSGVKLRLTGDLPAELVERVRSALMAGAANHRGAAAPMSFRPAGDLRPSAAPPAPRAHLTPPTPAAPAGAVSRTSSAMLVLADGRAIAVGAGAVLGRSPAPDPQLPAAALYALDDPSLSKTHATFGPAPTGVWVIDHHSTNGTMVLTGGQTLQCRPGVAAEVPFGAQVVAGELVMVVRPQ